MSHLRVVWPDEECPVEEEDGAAMTAVVPFYLQPRRRSQRMDAVTRAQTLFANRTCPHCDYAVVEPIELDDAVINRSGLPIPGTATLVGFHCCGCDTEWGV